VSEADADIAWLVPFADLVARNWESLRDPVLQIIKRVGGKTVPGLSVVNQCWQHGLVELGLMPLDGITISKREREHRSVCAPLINPAEGVRVEPYEAGCWFIRRASHAEPTSPASEPAASAVEPLQAELSAESAEPAAVPHLGGRPPVVNWEMVEGEVFRLMEHNGEFSDDDPDWNAQARLEEAIADFCETTFSVRPGETTIRERIREPLERWKQSRSET
jgi:hypothetical protein